MDRKERNADLSTLIISFLEGWQAELWTALPAVVQAYYPATQTVDLQCALQVSVRNPDGTITWHDIPKLVDCPVHFPSGGGYTLSFPLAAGDEGLVVFANKCIDAWWESGVSADTDGNITGQLCPDLRLHDLSDGIFLPGINSKPHVPGGLSTTSAQLRSDDGGTVIELAAGNVVNITANVVNVTAASYLYANTPELRVGGDIKINYNTLPVSVGHLISVYDIHTHGGVVAGVDHTFVPDQLV